MSFFDGMGSGRPVDTPSRSRPHGNLFALKVGVFALFGILTAQLINMQIIQGAEYAQRSRDNHIIAANVLPARGLIYDRNGELLVQNTGLYTASVVPDFLPLDDAQRYLIYLRLEELTGVPALEIQGLVARYEEEQPWTEIPVKRGLTREEALTIEEAAVDLPGVRLTITPSREYVGGTSLSHILGYIGPQSAEEVDALREAGYDINEPVGKAGVEAWYEADLRGEIGLKQNETDAHGRVLNVLDEIPSTPGSDLRLSIDQGLQEHTAGVLLDRLGISGSSNAAAVVMDAKTGELLALVSVPAYDNNAFSSPTLPENADIIEEWATDEWGKPLVNHAISDANIPGSVFKLVTATAGLEEGVITENTTVYAPKVLEQRDVNDQLFPLVDWMAHNRNLDVREAIAWSSNIFFYMTACGSLDNQYEGLGATRLGTWARNYGFGAPTGIDLSGETTGRVPSPEWKREWSIENFGKEDPWYYGNDCFMGIGQEYLTSSPIQIARMTAAVANGGTLVNPHVAKEIISADGKVTPITTETKTLPADAQTLKIIREGMLRSVNGGAGKNAAVDGVAVAGKTGTAEFRVRYDGTYDNHAWFTGFAPYDDPQVVVTVYFELGWGGDLAAPAAAQILDYYFEHVAP